MIYMVFFHVFNVGIKKMTPNHFIINICKALLIFKAQLNYNQIKLVQLSRVNLGSVRIGWLDSFLNDGEKRRRILRE